MSSVDSLSLYDDLKIYVRKIEHCALQMTIISSSVESLNSWGVKLSSAYDLLSQMSIEAVQYHMNSEVASSLRNSVLYLGQQCLLLIKSLGDTVTDIQAVEDSIENISHQVIIILDLVIDLETTTPYQEAIEALGKPLNTPNNDGPFHSEILLEEIRVLYNIVKAVLSNLTCSNEIIRATLRLLLHAMTRFNSAQLGEVMTEFLNVCEQSSQDLTNSVNKMILKDATKDLLQELAKIASSYQQDDLLSS